MSPAPRRRVLAGRALRTLVGPAGLLALLPLLPATAGEGLRIAFVEAPAGATESAGRDLGGTILAGRYPRGARLVIADLDDIGATRRSVSEGFTSAADPAFSLDGKGLLFAGCRAPGEPLQIWELGADFTRAVPLARCDADCVRPVPLPGGRIVFASLLAGEREEEGDRLSFSLFQWGRHLETPERLTFNPSSDFDPALLPDGRIAYSSWQHVGSHRPPRGTVALMLVNSDGTGVFPFTGNHRGPWLKRAAAPIGGGRTALIRADRFTGLGAGELVATSLDDPFAPYEILMPASRLQVAGVAALADGRLLLSARPANLSRPTFGLYLLEGGGARLLHDDPRRHEVMPAVGDPDRRPQRRISTVVPGTPHGYLLVLDCHESDRTDQGPLHPGAVAAVRVLEGVPHGDRGGSTPTRLLGEVAPAADGSLYLKVPADRPLRLQLIDREGSTLVDERAWFWVRPNERRVCIGCHEDRELSPRNATPLAARGEPADLVDPPGGTP